MICQHFISEDADWIIKIPPPRTRRPDRPLWFFDKHDNYSVKSAYQVALRLKRLDCPSPSKSSVTEWNGILKLELLEKNEDFYVESYSEPHSNNGESMVKENPNATMVSKVQKTRRKYGSCPYNLQSFLKGLENNKIFN